MNKDVFWKFAHDVFAAQGDITASNADEKLTGLADGAGAKGAEIAACAGKPTTQTRVEKSVELGKTVEVESTPTFFINGRKMSNIVQVPAEILKQILDFAAKAEN
jgi:protein-disulfide isomerase